MTVRYPDTDNPGYIYALVDPTDRRVHYVGQSIDPAQRFHNHVLDALRARETGRSNGAKDDWLLSLFDREVFPEYVILERGIDSRSACDAAELRWMLHYRQRGEAECNANDLRLLKAEGRRLVRRSSGRGVSEFAERRKALGLTQFALAVRLGVQPQLVNRWERGKRPPPAWLDLALKALSAEETGR